MIIEANLRKDWTTHMGVLTKVVLASSGDVLEFGSGPFSTPLLHWLCKDMNRLLISYENDLNFFKFAEQFESRLHRIRFVKDWDNIDTITHRGVVFVDHHPLERRETDAIRFKNSSDFVVIHDTEFEDTFKNVWSNFKHINTWKECRPWVSVVSNFRNLSQLL